MTKNILGCAAAGLVSLAASAAEPALGTTYGDVARVVSSVPVHARVPNLSRECRLEQTSYRTAANDSGPAGEVERCDAPGESRERIVAYDVTYEYNGRKFRARMPYEPGEQIPVNVEVRPPLPREAVRSAPIPRYRGTY